MLQLISPYSESKPAVCNTLQPGRRPISPPAPPPILTDKLCTSRENKPTRRQKSRQARQIPRRRSLLEKVSAVEIMMSNDKFYDRSQTNYISQFYMQKQTIQCLLTLKLSILQFGGSPNSKIHDILLSMVGDLINASVFQFGFSVVLYIVSFIYRN